MPPSLEFFLAKYRNILCCIRVVLPLRKREADAEIEFRVQMFTASNTIKRYIDEGAEICMANFSDYDAHERKRKQTSHCGSDFKSPSKPVREMLSKILPWRNGEALILLPSYHWLKDAHKNMPKVEGESNTRWSVQAAYPEESNTIFYSSLNLQQPAVSNKLSLILFLLLPRLNPCERNGYLRKVSYGTKRTDA